MSPVGQGDNNATFLAEFRALRDRAALEYEELAAIAHYPSDVLKEAESGPGLPGLPILAAYVRACGADVTEWEERWRRLAGDSDDSGPADPACPDNGGLPVRPAGASPAAKAGARAGFSIAPADVHDPERIKAALRANRADEDRGGGSGTGASTGGSNAGTATMLANGHHRTRRGLVAAHGHARVASVDSVTDIASVAPEADAAPATEQALSEPAAAPARAWTEPEAAPREASVAPVPRPENGTANGTASRTVKSPGAWYAKLLVLILVVLIGGIVVLFTMT